MAALPDVVILAGGRGTRLRPLVNAVPKVMAPVGGHPFLELVLDRVVSGGGSRVVLSVGYKSDLIEQHFGGRYRDVLTLVYSREPEPAGTGGGLALAARQVQTPIVLVLNGDSILQEDLARITAFHRAAGAKITMAVVSVADASRFGAVELAPDGRVIGFGEKRSRGSGLINAGVYVFDSNVLETIAAPSSLERDCFPRFLDGRMMAYRSEGRFADIGDPDSYLRFLSEAQDYWSETRA